MTGGPIEEDHRPKLAHLRWLVRAHWLVQAHWLVRAHRQKPEQIRWCASEWGTGALRVPGEGSRPIARGSAKIPAHKAGESTSDQALAPHLHPPARFQTTRDADTSPAHLWRKKRERPAW